MPPDLTLDLCEANDLRRHIFSNHIDLVMLKRLLTFIFDDFRCTCRHLDSEFTHCSGHAHLIDLELIGERLDIKAESLATLLAYIELDKDRSLFSIIQSGYSVSFKFVCLILNWKFVPFDKKNLNLGFNEIF